MNRGMRPTFANRAPAGRSMRDRFGFSGRSMALFGGGLLGGSLLFNNVFGGSSTNLIIVVGGVGLWWFLKK